MDFCFAKKEKFCLFLGVGVTILFIGVCRILRTLLQFFIHYVPKRETNVLFALKIDSSMTIINHSNCQKIDQTVLKN